MADDAAKLDEALRRQADTVRRLKQEKASPEEVSSPRPCGSLAGLYRPLPAPPLRASPGGVGWGSGRGGMPGAGPGKRGTRGGGRGSGIRKCLPWVVLFICRPVSVPRWLSRWRSCWS